MGQLGCISDGSLDFVSNSPACVVLILTCLISLASGAVLRSSSVHH